MIIRFTVDNVLSFNSEQELLLIPGKNRNLSHHVIKKEKARDVDILKASLIYGANASGKSNLIKAMLLMKKIVLEGDSDTINYDHFKLDGEAFKRPSKLEMEFNINGANYAYGITFNRQHIETEWLYYFNKEKDYKVFERKTTGREVEVSFDNLKLSKRSLDNLSFMGQVTKPAECFLHSLNNSNIEKLEGIQMLKDAYSWFDDSLTIIFPDTKFGGLEVGIESDDKFRHLFHWALEYFGTSIEGLESTEVDFFTNEVAIPSFVKDSLQKELKIGETYIVADRNDVRFRIKKLKDGSIDASKLTTKHSTVNMIEPFVSFEMNEESDGTQRIMDFIPALAELLTDNKVFIIDEIERSLHVNLVKKFISTFYERTSGIRSQLIATTHEVQLLDQDLVRKDEIWFVEKNNKGESILTGLEEYTVRKDLDIRGSYLQGRFGAIPKFYSLHENPLEKSVLNES